MLFIFPYPSPLIEECSYWLPLYGSMCCRLAAQPHCMTQQMMSGCLKVKVSWEMCVVSETISLNIFLTFALIYFSAFLPLHFSFPIVCCQLLMCCFASFSLHSTDLSFYLTAAGRWPSELDKSVCCSERNKPFLLPPARRRGGQCWASFHHCHQQGQQRQHLRLQQTR